MSFSETALLGPRTRVALAMFSVGVLVFLLVDVLAHGFEIAEDAVVEFKDGDGSFLQSNSSSLMPDRPVNAAWRARGSTGVYSKPRRRSAPRPSPARPA